MQCNYPELHTLLEKLGRVKIEKNIDVEITYQDVFDGNNPDDQFRYRVIHPMDPKKRININDEPSFRWFITLAFGTTYKVIV